MLHAWREWLPSAPEELTSVGRMLQFPPIPELPEFLRGKSFVVVEAVFLGSEADGRALLKPLRDLGPAMDTFAMRPPVGLSELHMDPPHPVPYVSSSLLTQDLSARRSTSSSPSRLRAPAPGSSASSCATSAARSAAPAPATARSRSCRARSRCSPSAWR